MPECIEREAALAFLRKCQVFKFQGKLPDGRICHFSDVRQGVADIPAADVDPEEVKDLQLEVAALKTIEKMYDGLGRPDHLRELAQAEKYGRLVALPCNIGDWVYCLWDVPTDYKYAIYCAEVKEIKISMRNCRLTTACLMEPIEYRGHRREDRDDDFGKTVFLSHEEAEAALKREEGGGEE